MTRKPRAMRYTITMPDGHKRPTALAPESKAFAAYAAYVQHRRCPVCGQLKLEDA